MGWIALIVCSVAGLGLLALSSRKSRRSYHSRRSDRLETAFFRARGQRMTTNGIHNRF